MREGQVFLGHYPFRHHPLAKWMASQGLRVSELALHLSVSPSAVYRWLDGSRTIPNEAMAQLSKVAKGQLPLDTLISHQVGRKRERLQKLRRRSKRG